MSLALGFEAITILQASVTRALDYTHISPQVIKLFLCSTQLSMKYILLINANIYTQDKYNIW